jgi:hypothetical protein
MVEPVVAVVVAVAWVMDMAVVAEQPDKVMAAEQVVQVVVELAVVELAVVVMVLLLVRWAAIMVDQDFSIVSLRLQDLAALLVGLLAEAVVLADHLFQVVAAFGDKRHLAEAMVLQAQVVVGVVDYLNLRQVLQVLQAEAVVVV